MVTGDDLYVDRQFDNDEKVVVPTEPSVVKTPADIKSLLAIRRRSHRGAVELSADGHLPDERTQNTSRYTAVAVVRAIRGPRSAVDAAVYLGVVVAARWGSRRAHAWERDESSRSSE
jgi:hypothetical protein